MTAQMMAQMIAQFWYYSLLVSYVILCLPLVYEDHGHASALATTPTVHHSTLHLHLLYTTHQLHQLCTTLHQPSQSHYSLFYSLRSLRPMFGVCCLAYLFRTQLQSECNSSLSVNLCSTNAPHYSSTLYHYSHPTTIALPAALVLLSIRVPGQLGGTGVFTTCFFPQKLIGQLLIHHV